MIAQVVDSRCAAVPFPLTTRVQTSAKESSAPHGVYEDGQEVLLALDHPDMKSISYHVRHADETQLTASYVHWKLSLRTVTQPLTFPGLRPIDKVDSRRIDGVNLAVGRALRSFTEI